MTSVLPLRIVRDAALIAFGSAAIALAVNALRREGIPLVQHKEYEILVPCPDITGDVLELDPSDPSVSDRSAMVIDARARVDFDKWHLPSAVSIPYDYLEPTSEQQVRRVISSKAARVVVYGDGENPDSGRELGKELAGKGVRNVAIVRGGAPALRTRETP